MLPFENMVAEYVKETNHHVRYRVTPIYQGEELLARGVTMEAQSVEDDEVSFYVFCYNAQPGVEIDYLTGDSRESEEAPLEPKLSGEMPSGEVREYILNENSMKFHDPECYGADQMKEENRKAYTGTREELIKQGYSPCGQCKP